ncbi:MAG: hypothetical protein KatS3mg028_1701 [Bacteroidia bacterium]|nr:MAG: hypothetical protein KatS3mg028_1701 [Bacteroidia bacterium]
MRYRLCLKRAIISDEFSKSVCPTTTRLDYTIYFCTNCEKVVCYIRCLAVAFGCDSLPRIKASAKRQRIENKAIRHGVKRSMTPSDIQRFVSTLGNFLASSKVTSPATF